MKSLCYFIFLVFFTACGGNDEKMTHVSDSIAIGKPEKKTLEIEPISEKTTKAPFYFIQTASHEKAEDAIEKVKELKKTYAKCGYLWIPDYESLSGKALFVSLIGPYISSDECIKELNKYKKTDAKAYALKADHKKERYEIHHSFDIRINGKKQKLVLIYSTPGDEANYTGEDWGWFVHDVTGYFGNYYNGIVMISSVYRSWYSDEEIKSLQNELNPEGFGYVLVDGNKKMFLNHDVSSSIIDEACRFFALENKQTSEQDQGE